MMTLNKEWYGYCSKLVYCEAKCSLFATNENDMQMYAHNSTYHVCIKSY
jgi:hypothetical protein